MINDFGLPTFDLKDYDTSWLNPSVLSADLIRRYRVIPLKKHSNSLQIGISNPADRHALDAITFYMGFLFCRFWLMKIN